MFFGQFSDLLHQRDNHLPAEVDDSVPTEFHHVQFRYESESCNLGMLLHHPFAHQCFALQFIFDFDSFLHAESLLLSIFTQKMTDPSFHREVGLAMVLFEPLPSGQGQLFPISANEMHGRRLERGEHIFSRFDPQGGKCLPGYIGNKGKTAVKAYSQERTQ